MKWVVVSIGAFIDALQFMLMIAFFALQFMTPVGGGGVGAITAGYACWELSDGVWEGLKSASECALAGTVVGAGASSFAIPLGMIVDFMISITFGGVLIVILWLNGMLRLSYVAAALLGESVPFISLLPGWTGFAYASARKKEKEMEEKRQTQEEQEERQIPSNVEATMPFDQQMPERFARGVSQNIDGVRTKSAA